MSNLNLDYLCNKVKNSKIIFEPFPHLEINNFLSDSDLELILKSKQIHFEKCKNIHELLKKLNQKKYLIQSFPGCSTDINDYLTRLQKNIWPHDRNGTPIETFGVTYRLKEYDDIKIKSIVDYLGGKKFEKVLKDKFSIKEETYAITAIQKNLTGYEISPHPDTRRKAMTYLLNINKDDSVENYNIHTHLLKFKNPYAKVYDIWKNKTKYDRCWVPWDWCQSIKQIKKNNTIVIFPTTNKSLHAVKMKYPHEEFQRTQIYGNLMFKENKRVPQRNYKKLKIEEGIL